MFHYNRRTVDKLGRLRNIASASRDTRVIKLYIIFFKELS